MEIEGTDGSNTQLKPDSTTHFGRGNGFTPQNDLSVSRHHISLHPKPTQTVPRVSFEVLGKNPVWILHKDGNENERKVGVFKRFEKGELGIGDKFCVSVKHPVWFTVKERESSEGEVRIGERVGDELSQSLEGYNGNGELELGCVGVSDIDPVKEFGFLVIGHEFDQYQKQMIRDIKCWDWFLEDPKADSDDEEGDEKKGKRGGRRKRKKARGDDDVDEEWTGESEDEKVATTKAGKVKRPKYHTRSNEQGKASKGRSDRKPSGKASKKEDEEEYEDEDEDEEDETLGGFIVDDVDDNEDEVDEDEDEEDEFLEDDDELED